MKRKLSTNKKNKITEKINIKNKEQIEGKFEFFELRNLVLAELAKHLKATANVERLALLIDLWEISTTEQLEFASKNINSYIPDLKIYFSV